MFFKKSLVCAITVSTSACLCRKSRCCFSAMDPFSTMLKNSFGKLYLIAGTKNMPHPFQSRDMRTFRKAPVKFLKTQQYRNLSIQHPSHYNNWNLCFFMVHKDHSLGSGYYVPYNSYNPGHDLWAEGLRHSGRRGLEASSSNLPLKQNM